MQGHIIHMEAMQIKEQTVKKSELIFLLDVVNLEVISFG